MSDSNQVLPASRPIHLWIVGIVALLWNAMGAVDYVMTQTKNEAYMSQFTQEQLDFFYGFPAWVVACWAIAVWGSVLATLLLLFRSKWASWVFMISTVALVVTMFQNYVLSNGMEISGDIFSVIFSALIFVISVVLTVYTFVMSNKGFLH